MDLPLFEVEHSSAELRGLLRRAKFRKAAPVLAGHVHEHGLLSRFARVCLVDSVLVISRVGDSRSDSERCGRLRFDGETRAKAPRVEERLSVAVLERRPRSSVRIARFAETEVR